MAVNIAINDNVLSKYTDLVFAFFIVEDHIKYENTSIKEKAENDIILSVSNKFNDRLDLSNHSFNEFYSKFYKEMGLKPKKVSTPIHQSLRVFDTQKYKSIYEIIDICMKIEYTTLLSFQVYDLDKINGSLMYLLSSGNDSIATFHNEEKLCKPGELIFVDETSVLHSAYYGNNKSKSISDTTIRSLVRIMGIPGIPRSNFTEAVDLFCKAIRSDNYLILDKNTPDASL